MQWVQLVIGFSAGILSGLFGIGGGIILIPALVYFLHLTQYEAQGTTLAAMIPPIGLLAALKYYAQGNVKVSIALFICAGFFIGGFLGAEAAHRINEPILKKLFGGLLFLTSIRMIFFK